MPTLRTILQLARLPAVFTAMADIFLGYLLTHQSLSPLTDFGLLVVGSSCLYLGGLIFNDVFDRHVDARERPNRPIPSGRIRAGQATALGAVLMIVGIIAAAAVSTASLTVAVALSLCILTYDGLLKQTLLGPVAMGGCRFLNVMLGASSATEVWNLPQLFFALALGIYIVGVTWFARNEARTSSRSRLLAATGIVNVAVISIVLALIGRGFTVPGVNTAADYRVVLFIFAVLLVTIDRRLVSAIVTPMPGKVQSAVKTMLLSYPMLIAGIVLFATGDAYSALAIACLLVPARFLSRWMAIT